MTVVSILTIVTHVKRLGLIENPGCDTGYLNMTDATVTLTDAIGL